MVNYKPQALTNEERIRVCEELRWSVSGKSTDSWRLTEVVSAGMTSQQNWMFRFGPYIVTWKQFRKPALAPETLGYLENISGGIKIDLGPTKDFSRVKEIVKELSEATASRKSVEILYQAVSTGRQTHSQGRPLSGMGNERSFLSDRPLSRT